MGVVTQWLEGIGLPPSVVSNFRAAGIVRPADLLDLEVVHYEALGVADPSDRRKLFFLVQRLKQAQAQQQQMEEEGQGGAEAEGEEGSGSGSGASSSACSASAESDEAESSSSSSSSRTEFHREV
mmetsp:Transcript_30783/g.89928  ORF Transcript_30783/g.89928 Transcript_30783/m.89928 type:complete len:125 (+) Transcript_30783:431-805(+)